MNVKFKLIINSIYIMNVDIIESYLDKLNLSKCKNQLFKISNQVNATDLSFLYDKSLVNKIELNNSILNTLKAIYKTDPLFDKSYYNSINCIKIAGNTKPKIKINKSDYKLYSYDDFMLYDEDFEKINQEYINKLCEYIIMYFYFELEPKTKYDLFNFLIIQDNIPLNYLELNYVYYSSTNKFIQLYWNTIKNPVAEEVNSKTYLLIRHFMKVYQHHYKKLPSYLFLLNDKPIPIIDAKKYFKKLTKKYFKKSISITSLF